MDNIQIFLTLGTAIGDLCSREPVRTLEQEKAIGELGAADAVSSLKRQTPTRLRQNVHQFLSRTGPHMEGIVMQEASTSETQASNRVPDMLGLARAYGLHAKAESNQACQISLIDQIKLPEEGITSDLRAVYKKRILLKERLANEVMECIGLRKEYPIIRTGVKAYYTRHIGGQIPAANELDFLHRKSVPKRPMFIHG
ncbi:hypothetical protein KEM56_003418 [Ascosphaera pollenicola]|nr:hypothetical protein KEM56_003418 [Ascosphaera pollenicola]